MMFQDTEPITDEPVKTKVGCNEKLDCAGQYMIARPCPGYRCKYLLRTVALCTGRGYVLVPEMHCEGCGAYLKAFTIEVTNDR